MFLVAFLPPLPTEPLINPRHRLGDEEALSRFAIWHVLFECIPAGQDTQFLELQPLVALEVLFGQLGDLRWLFGIVRKLNCNTLPSPVAVPNVISRLLNSPVCFRIFCNRSGFLLNAQHELTLFWRLLIKPEAKFTSLPREAT